MTIQKQIMDLVKQLNQEERTELLYEIVVSKGNNVLGFRLDTFDDLIEEMQTKFDEFESGRNQVLKINGKENEYFFIDTKDKKYDKLKSVALNKKLYQIAEYCDEDFLYRCDCRDINCPDTILEWVRFNWYDFINDIEKEIEAEERDEKLETILNGN